MYVHISVVEKVRVIKLSDYSLVLIISLIFLSFYSWILAGYPIHPVLL